MDVTTAANLNPADEDNIALSRDRSGFGAAIEGIQKTIESAASIIGEEISGGVDDETSDDLIESQQQESSLEDVQHLLKPFKPIHALRFFGTIFLTYYLWICTMFHHGQFIYPSSFSHSYSFLKDQLLKPIFMYALPSDYTCIWMYSLFVLWSGLQSILAMSSPSYHMYYSFIMNIFLVFILNVTNLLPVVEWYEHFIALFTCSLVGGLILASLSKTSFTYQSKKRMKQIPIHSGIGSDSGGIGSGIGGSTTGAEDLMMNIGPSSTSSTQPTTTAETMTPPPITSSSTTTTRISLPSIDMGYNLWFILSLSVVAKQFELYEYISYPVACQMIATFLICNYMIQLYMNSSVMGSYDGENDLMDVLDKSVVLPFFNTIPLIHQIHQVSLLNNTTTTGTTNGTITTTMNDSIPILPIVLFLIGYYIWSISNTQYMYFKQEYYFHGSTTNDMKSTTVLLPHRTISSFPYFLLSKTLTPRVVSSRDGSYILADSGWLLCRNIDLSGELLMVWSLFLLNIHGSGGLYGIFNTSRTSSVGGGGGLSTGMMNMYHTSSSSSTFHYFIPLLYAMLNTLDIITTERNRHLYYSRQYAQDWTRYCNMVPYSLIPFVY
ncbi:hypothetical protein C9374_013669 [Naegleria lovaniensis]|uniref:Transmembrane protein n=1 Tax=Naegleria lovaniensis TaxID=51637 RepID=A0AA88GEP6_NAELO|nr:uncharacterized protein C9374_013669 [Naegleria lovaniensis]KAG2372661.1 hypothetical protein C9374_013669 [Naegleria lovaniensis]